MRSRPLSTLVHYASFGRIKYGWYDCDYRSNAMPVFSGGCPRSGTTLLYSLLNAHSRIFVGIETGLLTGNRDIGHLTGRCRLSGTRLRGIYRKCRCYPQFAEMVPSSMAAAHGKHRWGDKSPVNVTLLDSIFRYFPDARFIHMIRDGRDSVCSIRKHPPSFGNINKDINPWQDCIDLWESWTRKGMQWRSHQNYYELKYESLVRQPEEELKKMFSWLGEPWEEEILKHARKIKVSSHPDISKPISNSSFGRWQSELPDDARKMFKGSASNLLVELGYTTDDHWIKT